MARRRNKKPQPETSSKPEKIGLFNKAWFAFIAATGAVFLASYTTLITGYVGPSFSSGVEWAEDHFFPMPADQRIVAQAFFFITQKKETQHSGELMGVSLNGTDCLKPGGASDYDLYDLEGEVTYTSALLRATCRPSGRTKVTITPRNGNPVVLFNGFIDGKKQVEIGGVEGSYEYGMLTVSYVGTNEPTGPLNPVNQTPPALAEGSR